MYLKYPSYCIKCTQYIHNANSAGMGTAHRRGDLFSRTRPSHSILTHHQQRAGGCHLKSLRIVVALELLYVKNFFFIKKNQCNLFIQNSEIPVFLLNSDIEVSNYSSSNKLTS